MLYLQILFILGLPLVLMRLEKKWNWFKAIVMSYIVGISIGNVFTEAFDLELVTEITGGSIVLAIPLMLFPTSIKNILKQPKTLLLAYGLAVIATTISVIIGYWLFKDSLANIAVICGMIEGVYTGGTVNLNAIGIAFDVSKELVFLMNGFDWSFSGLYLLLILTVLPKLLGYILPKSKISQVQEATFHTDGFLELGIKEKSISLAKGVGLSLVLLGVMAGISDLVYGELNELVLIFGVTGLSLVLSNVKSVQNLKGNMIASDYLMLIFGFTLGLQANVSEILSDRSELFNYFLITYSLMLVIHLLLAKLFKVDVHSFIISSTAAVFGPPFIGPVAESLGNRNLISSGIIIALIGNAVGTYLGIVIIKILMG